MPTVLDAAREEIISASTLRIAQRLSWARRCRQMSSRTVSVRAGRSSDNTNLTAYERGVQRPKLSTVLRLASAVEIDPVWLAGFGPLAPVPWHASFVVGTDREVGWRFGRVVRRHRLALGMTATEFNAAMGSASATQGYESRGYVPHITTVYRGAIVLEVSVKTVIKDMLAKDPEWAR